MISPAHVARFPTAPARWLGLRLAVASFLALSADWLLFGRRPGVALPIFLLFVVLAALALNPLRAERRWQAIGLAFVALNLAALVEEVNLLSLALAILGVATTALVLFDGHLQNWRELALRAVFLPFSGFLRLPGDASYALKLAGRRNKALRIFTTPFCWIMPAALFGLCLYLFAQANPLIESALHLINLRFLFDLLLEGHPLFWAAIACAVWPMLHLRTSRARRASAPTLPDSRLLDPRGVFGDTAFERTLYALNGLFALQSALDLTFLWGGLALPGGMSYAEYAHRGAYPLVATALIAALVVLAATRPGGPAERTRAMPPLVLAFTGQNILLVISSMLRLKLYVEIYSLTYWRLAAALWFILVAIGLASIIAQILLGKSPTWLLKVNAAALAAMLYACCFLDFPL
ncbi:MAG TPA: DUF4173 domain-containing protein, partial [Methylocystis sp.]|nr:DUF4173 domain-containing protein [Methylocystis sp.]